MADDPAGPEFDGSWSPDGKWIAYRDSWSPDGNELLISGAGLYVVRLDGTGRLEIRTPALSRALGAGIPDWG